MYAPPLAKWGGHHWKEYIPLHDNIHDLADKLPTFTWDIGSRKVHPFSSSISGNMNSMLAALHEIWINTGETYRQYGRPYLKKRYAAVPRNLQKSARAIFGGDVTESDSRDPDPFGFRTQPVPGGHDNVEVINTVNAQTLEVGQEHVKDKVENNLFEATPACDKSLSPRR